MVSNHFAGLTVRSFAPPIKASFAPSRENRRTVPDTRALPVSPVKKRFAPPIMARLSAPRPAAAATDGPDNAPPEATTATASATPLATSITSPKVSHAVIRSRIRSRYACSRF